MHIEQCSAHCGHSGIAGRNASLTNVKVLSLKDRPFLLFSILNSMRCLTLMIINKTPSSALQGTDRKKTFNYCEKHVEPARTR